MIASLRGTVLEVSLTGAVIEVGGLGMAFQATPATLAGLRVGEEGHVHTELLVREDSMTLFGFADADERHCFRVLLGAKGVGAKLALAVLAVHTPDALRRAIAAQDVAALKRVPGLGPKGAQRVIIDIGDKLGWNEAVAVRTVAAVESEQAAENAEPSVPELLRASLRRLGGGSRG